LANISFMAGQPNSKGIMMKFTLSWLKDHLDTTAQVDEIADHLTDLGLEVEAAVNPAARLATFTLAHVIDAAPHPDADKLRVCRVMTDEGEKQIVCGAPNARAGITVVLCKPGDYVPGLDVTLGVGKIRGVESHGMMASERELELSDEHNGIIELSSGAVGQKFTDWLAVNRPAAVDPMIHIKITPNRPDALGVRGIARDLAARGLGVLKPLAIPQINAGFASPIGVHIDPALKAKGCPHFAGRVIRGVKNGPSPDWLAQRIKAIGLRPISALVDITNYFTFGLNRPLHVFDMAKVRGDLRIVPAKGGEQMLALDGKTYTLRPGMMAICDDAGVESLAGIMGGEVSGCGDETVDVFLESAYWDPITIATTGRALKINSDARYRFERGIDPAFTLDGLDLATQMVLDLCGGTPSEVVQDGAPPQTARAYAFDPARVASLVGMDIPEARQRAILQSLGFTFDGAMAAPPQLAPRYFGRGGFGRRAGPYRQPDPIAGAPLAPRPARRAQTDFDPAATARADGAAHYCGAGLSRMCHLQLYRPYVCAHVWRGGRCFAR
jgi:phenylalanyl-tRNA synthetase beta chain